MVFIYFPLTFINIHLTLNEMVSFRSALFFFYSWSKSWAGSWWDCSAPCWLSICTAPPYTPCALLHVAAWAAIFTAVAVFANMTMIGAKSKCREDTFKPASLLTTWLSRCKILEAIDYCLQWGRCWFQVLIKIFDNLLFLFKNTLLPFYSQRLCFNRWKIRP